MAINPNNAHAVEHACYCGTSGGGKTVAVKLLGLIPDSEPVAILDIYGDYLPNRRRKLSGLGGRKVYHYTTRMTFYRAFVDAWSSGKPFAVAYQPQCDSAEDYKTESAWFADLIWKASDGQRRLHVVFEEMAKYMDGTGKASNRIGEIATGGRKFGLVCHFVFQRPTEVPKTLITQAAVLVVGAQQAMIDAKRWAEELDCSLDEIKRLGDLNQQAKNTKYYLVKRAGIGNYQQTSLSF